MIAILYSIYGTVYIIRNKNVKGRFTLYSNTIIYILNTLVLDILQ
jgi:hypothetical protein